MCSEVGDPMEEGGRTGAGAGGGGGGGGGVPVPFGGSCSICFEAVSYDDRGRSRAKLQCGHEFHLDCIGSAFNVKGMMQCPNCRKIEKGQWLYANGSRSYPDFSMDELVHDEDLYDLGYSELPFHWCPFGGLTRVPPLFEEGDLPSTMYHDLLGHHTIFAEHTAASSAAHSCPYVAYFPPLQPSSLNSNDGVADVPSFSQQWNGLSGSSDISTSHTYTATDLHNHTWEHLLPSFSQPSNHFGGTDHASISTGTLRSSRNDSDSQQPRSGSFVHPIFISHGFGPRAGSSIVSPSVPPYPGSNSRSHERAPGIHAYRRQHRLSTPGMRSSLLSNIRRSSGLRAPIVPVASSSESNNGLHMYPSSGSSTRTQEADNSVRNHLYAWERDRFAPFPLIPVDRDSSWWGPFHQATAGSDSSSRSSSFWHRQGSERTSQGRSENPSFQASHPAGPMHRFI